MFSGPPSLPRDFRRSLLRGRRPGTPPGPPGARGGSAAVRGGVGLLIPSFEIRNAPPKRAIPTPPDHPFSPKFSKRFARDLRRFIVKKSGKKKEKDGARRAPKPRFSKHLGAKWELDATGTTQTGAPYSETRNKGTAPPPHRGSPPTRPRWARGGPRAPPPQQEAPKVGGEGAGPGKHRRASRF